MKMSDKVSRRLQRSLIVFPALALAVTVGCVSSSGAAPSPEAKKTTTTLKKKKVVTTTVVKGVADPVATGGERASRIGPHPASTQRVAADALVGDSLEVGPREIA
jgi:hypothetical protein